MEASKRFSGCFYIAFTLAHIERVYREARLLPLALMISAAIFALSPFKSATTTFAPPGKTLAIPVRPLAGGDDRHFAVQHHFLPPVPNNLPADEVILLGLLPFGKINFLPFSGLPPLSHQLDGIEAMNKAESDNQTIHPRGTSVMACCDHLDPRQLDALDEHDR
jgi:hypothetical protein